MKLVLILEDSPDRLNLFRTAVCSLGVDWHLREWRDAAVMIAECESCFGEAALISLDHDLTRQSPADPDPGTGLDVANFLAGHLPVCPVIIHSSNTDASWSMHNELRFAGWRVERVGPLGNTWIPESWLPKARELISAENDTARYRIPPDHAQRMDRALLSLEGLAIGDALGEMLSYRFEQAAQRIADNRISAGPWLHTDDTEMAVSIVEVLRLYGFINQDALARRFAWRFQRDPDRGYGSMTRRQMHELLAGASWWSTAAAAFGGQGSMGNGGAMRVAPLGAYFADDLNRTVAESQASCTVTHTHPEGVAGTIAVAVATAVAWQLRKSSAVDRARQFFATVLEHTPRSEVWDRIGEAAVLPLTIPVQDAAKTLGNGALVTAPDTVPFALWCAAQHLGNNLEAMRTVIAGGGDCDTNAAIVGGIVSLAGGWEAIPPTWRTARERLPFDKIS